MFELSQMEPMLCCGCGLVLSIQLLLECILFFFFFWFLLGCVWRTFLGYVCSVCCDALIDLVPKMVSYVAGMDCLCKQQLRRVCCFHMQQQHDLGMDYGCLSFWGGLLVKHCTRGFYWNILSHHFLCQNFWVDTAFWMSFLAWMLNSTVTLCTLRYHIHTFRSLLCLHFVCKPFG